MSRHHHLTLSDSERQTLEALVRGGVSPARTQTRARILLLSDRNQAQPRSDDMIAAVLGCSVGTVRNVRRRYLSEGLSSALYDKVRLGREPKITGEVEAQLTVLACSTPPDGHARWTLRLLAQRLVELGCVPSISHVAVGQALKKTTCNRGG